MAINKGGQIKGKDKVYEDTTIDTKLDFNTIMFNTIERIIRSQSKDNIQLFVDNVNSLDDLMSPYQDKIFHEAKKEMDKDITMARQKNKTRSGMINPKVENIIQFNMSREKFRHLMSLIHRRSLIPASTIEYTL